MNHAFVCLNHATYGGVYYCANFTTSGAITWAKLTTTGLPSTLITHFRVDYGDPLNRQYVMIGSEIYTRTTGPWSKILDMTIAAAAASQSATNAQLAWLYTDPTVPGSVYSIFMTDPNNPAPQSGLGYVLKSINYGASWTALQFSATPILSRIACVEAIGNNIWVSSGKLILATSFVSYSPDGGTTFYGQGATGGSSGTPNLRINPFAPNKVYAWGDGDSHEWTYSGGSFSSRDIIPLASAGNRTDRVWFDPLVEDRVIYHVNANIYYSEDNFATYTTTGSSESNPAGTVGPSNVSGSTELLDGAGSLPNKSVAYYTTPTDTSADERGGANVGTPPYTDSVPNVAGLSMYGVWWGIPPSYKAVYVYADEQGDVDDVPTYTGLGAPMFGDRSSFRDMYADGYDRYHAQDVHAATPQIHAPWPAASGTAPVSNGSKYVATDIATQAELDTHAALVTHHAAVTLDADADQKLSVSAGQQITYDTQAANTVLAGPTTGAAAKPNHRALVLADLPAIALDNLSDVNMTGVVDGNFIKYDLASATYIPTTGIDATALHEHIVNEDHESECNGSEDTFTTAFEFRLGSTAVYLNGLRQRLNTDYTEAVTLDSITFVTPPETDDVLTIDYIISFTDYQAGTLLDSNTVTLYDSDSVQLLDSG